MSEALERVIAQQQSEIDQLKARLAAQQESQSKDFNRKENLLSDVAHLLDWAKLRDCWKDDKKTRSGPSTRRCARNSRRPCMPSRQPLRSGGVNAR